VAGVGTAVESSEGKECGIWWLVHEAPALPHSPSLEAELGAVTARGVALPRSTRPDGQRYDVCYDHHD